MVPAPQLTVSIVGGSGRHENGWVSEEGSFVVAARDADAFSDQHPSIRGAPMRVVDSRVLAREPAVALQVPPSNTSWESHRFCVLEPSQSQYFMAFEEVLKVHNAKCVEQKAFDGRVSHPWLSCSCCL